MTGRSRGPALWAELLLPVFLLSCGALAQLQPAELPLGAKILGGAIDSLVVSQGLVRAYQVVNKVEVQKGTFSYTQGTSTYTKSESMGSYVAERSNATYQARRHSLPFTPPPSPPPLAAASLPEQRAGAHAWVYVGGITPDCPDRPFEAHVLYACNASGAGGDRFEPGVHQPINFDNLQPPWLAVDFLACIRTFTVASSRLDQLGVLPAAATSSLPAAAPTRTTLPSSAATAAVRVVNKVEVLLGNVQLEGPNASTLFNAVSMGTFFPGLSNATYQVYWGVVGGPGLCAATAQVITTRVTYACSPAANGSDAFDPPLFEPPWQGAPVPWFSFDYFSCTLNLTVASTRPIYLAVLAAAAALSSPASAIPAVPSASLPVGTVMEGTFVPVSDSTTTIYITYRVVRGVEVQVIQEVRSQAGSGINTATNTTAIFCPAQSSATRQVYAPTPGNCANVVGVTGAFILKFVCNASAATDFFNPRLYNVPNQNLGSFPPWYVADASEGTYVLQAQSRRVPRPPLPPPVVPSPRCSPVISARFAASTSGSALLGGGGDQVHEGVASWGGCCNLCAAAGCDTFSLVADTQTCYLRMTPGTFTLRFDNAVFGFTAAAAISQATQAATETQAAISQAAQAATETQAAISQAAQAPAAASQAPADTSPTTQATLAATQAAAQLKPRLHKKGFAELAACLADVTVPLKSGPVVGGGVLALLVCDCLSATLPLLRCGALELVEGDWVRLLTAAAAPLECVLPQLQHLAAAVSGPSPSRTAPDSLDKCLSACGLPIVWLTGLAAVEPPVMPPRVAAVLAATVLTPQKLLPFVSTLSQASLAWMVAEGGSLVRHNS
ncbi:hypothetical protein CHLNCDRAFT_138966 [Chlorella variabilis]|uniref:Apple domain-containing protein n=1 Tax=Chlorella variabilis TaxID=554065 RepID=E1ZP20_CHLVA|nr:hypothetical protein CHLNCDRAFT_138966 [Chlorella variabilis]EFN52438.1 hypothetical protein CHLNCDRAFT_138966 [Chlorella variabilis]|eukprot:XP_005844540.1 hypothetical protein CHLNCDRAFT_138966 [Chlorella variabilis]